MAGLPWPLLAMVGLVLPLAPGLVLVCEATRATAVCACLLLDAGWLSGPVVLVLGHFCCAWLGRAAVTGLHLV